MGRHTPSRMPMLARSTSSRWPPKTMTSARGATGVWLCMPPPGQRSPSTSPRRSRSQRRRAPALPLSCRPPPPRSATRGPEWAVGPWQCVGQLDWSWLPMVSSLFNPHPSQPSGDNLPPPPPPPPPHSLRTPPVLSLFISSILHTLRTYHASRHRCGGGQSHHPPLQGDLPQKTSPRAQSEDTHLSPCRPPRRRSQQGATIPGTVPQPRTPRASPAIAHTANPPRQRRATAAPPGRG